MQQSTKALCVMAALAVGCATTPAPKAEVPVVQPGAERWEGRALELPAASPVVLTLRTQNLIRGLDEVLGWAGDAGLYTDEGPGFDVTQKLLRAYVGMGDDTFLSQRGVNTRESILVGVTSLNSGRNFVRDIDQILYKRFGADASNLITRLDDAQNITGLHTEITQHVHAFPVLGARIIIPATDGAKLGRFLEESLTTLGFKSIPGERLAEQNIQLNCRAMMTDELPLSFCVRTIADTVYVDAVIAREAAGRPDLTKTLLGALGELNTSKTGRPLAPLGAANADAQIAFDAAGMAELTRIVGYEDALAVASRESADSRDDALVTSMADQLMSAKTWSIQSDKMPGFSYALNLGTEEDGIAFTFEMTYFLAHDVARLVVQPAKFGLGLNQRMLGAGVSASPFQDPSWRALMSIDEPTQLLEILSISDGNPVYFYPAMPRLALVALHNMIASGPNSLNPLSDVMPVIAQLNRLEMAWLGDPDGNNPKLLMLATIQPEATASDRLLVATHVADFGAALVGFERNGPFEISQTPAAVPLVSAPGYVVSRQDFVAIGLGLERDEFERELQSVRPAEPSDEFVTMRAEPATWVPLLAHRYGVMKQFDLPSLAQRLGPVTISAFPKTDGQTQTLRWRIEWKRPVRL